MTITIVDREGTSHNMPCKVGDNVLQLMRIFQEKNPKLYLEGACESSLACSTCHIILDDKSYNLLQQIKESTEEEEDLLDMASCLTPTSRLGCQINLVKGMDGSTISLPKFSRNFYVDGHVPQPH
jgi:ferredoxin